MKIIKHVKIEMLLSSYNGRTWRFGFVVISEIYSPYVCNNFVEGISNFSL